MRRVWDAIRAVREVRPRPAAGFGAPYPSPGGTLDAERLEEIQGHHAARGLGRLPPSYTSTRPARLARVLG